MMTVNQILPECKLATWFMFVINGRHVMFLDNERSEILERFGHYPVRRVAGFGGHYSTTQSVKFELI